jgi:hypothetical protein
MLVNKTIQDQVENNSIQLEGIVNKVVASYTDKLDDYMNKIHTVLVDEGDDLTESELAKIHNVGR